MFAEEELMLPRYPLANRPIAGCFVDNDQVTAIDGFTVGRRHRIGLIKVGVAGEESGPSRLVAATGTDMANTDNLAGRGIADDIVVNVVGLEAVDIGQDEAASRHGRQDDVFHDAVSFAGPGTTAEGIDGHV